MNAITPDPEQVRDLAAAFTVTAGQHDRAGSFPHDHFAILRDAGLLALTTPAMLGGGGASLRTAAEVVRGVSHACASTGLVLAMQYLHHDAIARNKNWPSNLAAIVGRTAVTDGALINSLRVEPELGTPARGGLPATIARRTAEGWSLSGTKIYCTGVPGLTWLHVWARTDETAPRVGSFLIRSNSPGICVVENWDHLGLRASGSHTVILENVELPAEHAVDIRPPEDWRARDAIQARWNVTLVSAVYTGVAEAARDWLRAFLRDRVPSNLGAPLASLPRMQEAMGRIEARLVVNSHLLDVLADTGEPGKTLTAVEIDLLKVTIADNAIEATQDAVGLCGNHALMRANPLERHLRDVFCSRIHTPQADSAYIAAGRARLGV